MIVEKALVQILGISVENTCVHCRKENLILPELIAHCRKNFSNRDQQTPSVNEVFRQVVVMRETYEPRQANLCLRALRHDKL